VETQAQTVLTLGLEQIPKYTAWMGPLVRVTYSGLTQSVFRLDRVKSISCDCPENIPLDVDSNASCFTSCISGGRVLSNFTLGLFYRLGLSLDLYTFQHL
jgi:hypothetical protein